MKNFNKLLPLLFLTCCNCNTPKQDVVLPHNVTTNAVTSSTEAPVTSVTEVVDSLPEVVENKVTYPSTWVEVKREYWSLMMPEVIENKDSKINFDFLAAIKMSNNEELMFSVASKKSDKDILFLRDEMVELLNVRNVISIENHLQIDNTHVIMLDTSWYNKEANSVGFAAYIYLLTKNDLAISFSCGKENFDNDSKELCTQIMKTLKVY